MGKPNRRIWGMTFAFLYMISQIIFFCKKFRHSSYYLFLQRFRDVVVLIFLLIPGIWGMRFLYEFNALLTNDGEGVMWFAIFFPLFFLGSLSFYVNALFTPIAFWISYKGIRDKFEKTTLK